MASKSLKQMHVLARGVAARRSLTHTTRPRAASAALYTDTPPCLEAPQQVFGTSSDGAGVYASQALRGVQRGRLSGASSKCVAIGR